MKILNRIWAWSRADIGKPDWTQWIGQYFFWLGVGIVFLIGLLESL